MIQRSKYEKLWCLVSLILIQSCQSFWGKKSDLGFIEVPVFRTRPVAYVPLQPFLSGFEDITDVIVGYDQLIYTADAGTQQIRAYDESLRFLSSLTVPGLTKIAQDRRLDLYALGTLDTVINSTKFILACIYKFDLKSSAYGLNQARLIQKIVHPFYLTSTVKLSDNQVRFTGLATLADNSFYVTRTGPSAANLIGGPDDGILFFNGNKKNAYQYNIQVVTSSQGLRNDFFKRPIGITSFVMPPQSTAIRSDFDFAYISAQPTEPLKVKLMQYFIVDDAPAYQLNQELILSDTSKASGFLYTPGKFSNPVDITYSGDANQLLFIADESKDSIFIFNRNGLEGVRPPAGSTSTKNISVSFGGKGQGLMQFNGPKAVAYTEEILYVADAGNKRLLRFRLTTDFR